MFSANETGWMMKGVSLVANNENKPLTYQEKHQQIRKEAKWTSVLFAICFIWWCVTGWGLGNVKIYFLCLPLWFWLCIIGTYVIGCVGTIILVKKVFVNFDLGEDENDYVESTVKGESSK